MASLEDQIMETTEVRRHNGQCPYGPWLPLADAPEPVQVDVSAEVAEAMFGDMRQTQARGNTDTTGTVNVGGNLWQYRR